ncbi:MAG: hypothetical protein RL391_146 [Actinomycetota bacterium]|jgi:uncharacterized MAPEG superfamily protein
MTLVLLAVVVLCAAVFLSLAASRRRAGSDDAVASFRKHLDALSLESRQSVIDRARLQMNHEESPHGA